MNNISGTNNVGGLVKINRGLLSMELKEFLAIYRYFYGTNYDTYLDLRKNRRNHLRAQSLYYLLSCFVGGVDSCSFHFGYTWSRNSPYSHGLEGYLCRLFAKKEEIKSFYCFEYSDERASLFVNLVILRKLDYFKRIFFSEEIKSFLREIKHSDADWIKLLALIVFLKNTLKLSADFSRITSELKERGIWWSQTRLNKISLNKMAWELLQTVEVVD